MSASFPRKEPASGFVGHPIGRFNTTIMRLQLGASNNVTSLQERGILNLNGDQFRALMSNKQSQWSPWVPPPNSNDYNSSAHYPRPAEDEISPSFETAMAWFGNDSGTRPWILNSRVMTQRSPSTTLCIYCEADLMADMLLSCLFNDILAETGSPALALQAYHTVTLSRAYYAYLPTFWEYGIVTMSSFSGRLSPKFYRGYWSVVGLIILHCVSCSVITMLFFRKTKYSHLGNSWLAFAQMAQSKSIQEVISGNTLVTDKMIKKRIDRDNYLRRKHRLVPDDIAGNVTLKPVEVPIEEST